MPRRGYRLNDFEKGQITFLFDEGKSAKVIRQRLNRSYNCIKLVIQRQCRYSCSSGRPTALNDHQKRHIARVMLSQNPPSLRQIIAEQHLNVSSTTISNFFKVSGWQYVSALKVPALTNQHKVLRLRWAKGMLIDFALKELV